MEREAKNNEISCIPSGFRAVIGFNERYTKKIHGDHRKCVTLLVEKYVTAAQSILLLFIIVSSVCVQLCGFT